MKKQALPKSYALLWFYDLFFCHENPLIEENYGHDVVAAQEEYEKDPYDRKWPDEDYDETLKHFPLPPKDRRKRFAKKAGKTIREIRLYEKQIRAFEGASRKPEDQAQAPWYYALLALYSELFSHHEVSKEDFLIAYGLNERTFKRYLHTIRTYEDGLGRHEFLLLYDKKKNVYRFAPSLYPSPLLLGTLYKTW
jgi:hypothetical protein